MTKGPAKKIEDITKGFAKNNYICSKQISSAVYLANELEKPILVEGPPGVGKTELANTAALYYKKDLLRLTVRDSFVNQSDAKHFCFFSIFIAKIE